MVYIDSFNAPFGRMLMCHMLADNTMELLLFAEAIGVNLKWIQDAGTSREHFDICQSKKRIALSLGAQQASIGEMGRIMEKRIYGTNRKQV